MERSRVVAILNVTPDSFSDGGALDSPDTVVRAAVRAINAGAAVLDIGGESTRPGAPRVCADTQAARVVPAVRELRARKIDTPISIDTTRAAVARAALDAGADAINDVSGATEDPGMLSLAAEYGAGLILMHRAAPPDEDHYSTSYAQEPDYGPAGVVGSVTSWLARRAAAAADAGVAPGAIVLDPGLGFGKSVAQNFQLIAGLPRLAQRGFPVLCGASRKSFLGAVTLQHEPADRVAASVAAAIAVRLMGASLFRVHDIAAHTHALAVADTILAAQDGRPLP